MGEVVLIGRVQFVKCRTDRSSTSTVLSGVLQGSVLGPLLFLLYTVELLQARDLSGHSYANETQLYSSCKTSDGASLRPDVLHCIEDVAVWTATNRLKLNPDKTELMWCATGCMQHYIDRSPFVTCRSTTCRSTHFAKLAYWE
jgi:Reverse transcriptase (RNA-dependent DNA polymerase)